MTLTHLILKFTPLQQTDNNNYYCESGIEHKINNY